MHGNGPLRFQANEITGCHNNLVKIPEIKH
jgi:hypothetical protein